MTSEGQTERDRQPRVVVPDEPPALTPSAAAALLRLLLRAHQHAVQERELRAEDQTRPAGEGEVPQVDTDGVAEHRKAA